jgi:pyruvate dehydrogenase E2 component (dihydrolipoamide acetyltransferase)
MPTTCSLRFGERSGGMATEIKLPRLGQGMEAGTIVKWLKSEGDRVEKGEPLYELDTDKVTQEVEADASGVLLKIAVRDGEVPVGQTIAVIGEQGEQVPELEQKEAATAEAEQSAEKPAVAPQREPERERGREASTDDQITQVKEPAARPVRDSGPVEADQEVPPAERQGNGRVKASPLARRIARERGVDLAQIRGTGPEGRIVAEDVERAGAAPAAQPSLQQSVAKSVERVPLTSVRKTIARRLTEAWQAPVFQIAMTADMTRALELRARLVELHPDARPTVSDLLTQVCAAALMRHREVNATWGGDAIELHPTANVGIAVAAPQGLVVPVIRSCERLAIAEIAAARADVVDRARNGKLQQGDLDGGTFTISNLGMYGVERFIAVLNPPQAAILAVGAAEERPVVRDGAVVARATMELTLTCDHRAVDGATGAEFLRTLKTLLEEPGLAL